MVKVTYTISDDKYEEFKQYFLITNPVPQDDETGKPLFTENQWVKEAGRLFFINSVKRGKRKLAVDSIDSSISDDTIQ